jgi:hypothetical protein
MLVNILEICAITISEVAYYWGLVEGGQIVYLNEGVELNKLTTDIAHQEIRFTIMEEPIILCKWIVTRKKGLAIPQDKIMDVARLLIYEKKGLFTLFHLLHDKLDIPINKQWFFSQSETAWYQYLFEELYEHWKAFDEEMEPDEQLRIDALDEYWQKQTKMGDFHKWINTTAELKLRVVGDKYHLEKDQIKLLSPHMPINLLLESHNDRDNRAIGIYLTDGRQLGYLRKPVARKLYDRLSFESWSAHISWVDAEQWSNHRVFVSINFL